MRLSVSGTGLVMSLMPIGKLAAHFVTGTGNELKLRHVV